MKLRHIGNERSFAHGIHPPEHKDATAGLAIRRLPFAPELVVLLTQHLGAPAVSIVREDQEVVRGEPIAEAGAFVSVPMHAPVTGKVSRIGLAPNARGDLAPAIFITSSAGASQQILYGAPRDIDLMTPKELATAVQDTGVVGLGGAAFPTHVKLSVPKGKSVDTVIVNGCECEPYLTTDHRIMLERAGDIIAGVRIVLRALGAGRAIIGTEDNKTDAAEALRAAIPEDLPVTVETLTTKYPQGAEKMLSEALLRREIPSGGLPADVGVGVFNVATLAQIGDLLPRRQGLIERVVTVTGPGVKRPGNYLTALGTPLRFLLGQAGLTDDANTVLLGGPMMGTAVSGLDTPVTKGVTGIVVFTPEIRDGRDAKVYPCIKCGECLTACPLYLNPSRLGILARKDLYETMEQDYHLNDCFECGCCGYVCPSNIPLVQHFRMAKAANRKRKAQS